MAKDKGHKNNTETVDFSRLMHNAGVVPLKSTQRSVHSSTVNIPKAVPIIPNIESTPITVTKSSNNEDKILCAADVISYCSQRISKNIFRKFRTGRFPIADDLDLHGLTRQQAYALLLDFLQHTLIPSQHCIRVIHGKGHRSTENRAILKTNVNCWLQQHSRVLAFHSCIPKDGGTGAVYVLLKRL